MLRKYIDTIKLPIEDRNEALAPMRTKEMHKLAELEIAKLEGKTAKQEQVIQELTATYPINYAAVLDAIDELELTQRKIRKFSDIVKELF